MRSDSDSFQTLVKSFRDRTSDLRLLVSLRNENSASPSSINKVEFEQINASITKMEHMLIQLREDIAKEIHAINQFNELKQQMMEQNKVLKEMLATPK
ncbi:hypothetical protein SAMD00019534_044400 [Acytostelium subglobosum LB1]|uniref:hypothetical protein n=1 Tax=Acytostelium subglobosum LB1 TaxID=1410327 RepID=UPI000644D220|nr:hypothetical protein SAMD00019534_044400 [Acytostelium subglobosum LB1]GAM21265.1 hypothetical protein SAMD00019534_044400 [Acytostelium subglobosum LB1]|eukprot:XP_012755384.1 hypothetical protein SAMD00019534_044400 [Acytostelium subglobosum LB1]